MNQRSRVNITDEESDGLKSLNTNEVEATRFPSIVKQDPNEVKIYGRQRSTKKPHAKKEESKRTAYNIWIVKPGENTNRGNGINVCCSLKEVNDILSANMFDYHTRTFIVQKYIEKPQLYKQRKFDIRCYGLLTSVNGNLMGYFYDPDPLYSREGGGYIRTSSREYTLTKDKLANKLVHLTNDAVQKKADDYGRHEIGNKISFKDYQQYLNDTYPELGIDFQRDIFGSQVKRIVTDTFRAVYKDIDPNRRSHCFEVFGYDFMLDQDFKVQLIEVNTNPCIETAQCPILQRVITDMLDSAFRIAVDPLFPPPSFTKRMS